MKWLALHIDTSPAGLEPVSDMLGDLGIEGLVIEDEGDFRQFLETNHQYWDYVDEELDQSMTGKCRITFYVEDNDAGFITKNNASVNNHYATILKWWQEDKGGFL